MRASVWTKLKVSSVAIAAAISVVTVAAASVASAQPPTVDVVDADGGVYWRDSSDWNSAIANPGHGVYTGDRVTVECIETTTGGTVPPLWNNSLWYRVSVISGRGAGQSGLLNDHFLNTGINQPNQPLSGVPSCGTGQASSSTQPINRPVEVGGEYMAPGGNLAAKLFTHYSAGLGTAVNVDWRWLTPYQAFTDFAKGLPIDPNGAVWRAPWDTDLFWALGSFTVARTSTNCFLVYDKYDFDPKSILDGAPAWGIQAFGAREFQVFASGCLD